MSAENRAILEEVKKLISEGGKLAGDGSRKAAQSVLKEAYSKAKAASKLHIVGVPFAHAQLLQELGTAQANAGDFRGAQKSFKLARWAALDATRAITSSREREEFADDIAIEEALLFLEQDKKHETFRAVKQIKDKKRCAKGWAELGKAKAASGTIDEAVECFGHARERAAKIKQHAEREFFLDDLALQESEALAHAPDPAAKAPDGEAPLGGKAATLHALARANERATAGDKAALQELVGYLDHVSAEVRHAAIRNVSELSFRRELDRNVTIGPLFAALKHSDPVLAEEASAAFDTLILVGGLNHIPDQELVAEFSGLLKHSSMAVRKNAVKALRNLRDTTAIPSLLSLLKPGSKIGRMISGDKSEQLRIAVIEALEALDDEICAGALLHTLRKDLSDNVREYAIRALARLGGVEAAPDIAKLLKHPRLSHAASGAVLAYRERGLISFEQVEMLKLGLNPEEVVPRR